MGWYNGPAGGCSCCDSSSCVNGNPTSFTDDFADGTIDSAWTQNPTGGQWTETGGLLRFQVNATYPGTSGTVVCKAGHNSPTLIIAEFKLPDVASPATDRRRTIDLIIDVTSGPSSEIVFSFEHYITSGGTNQYTVTPNTGGSTTLSDTPAANDVLRIETEFNSGVNWDTRFKINGTTKHTSTTDWDETTYTVDFCNLDGRLKASTIAGFSNIEFDDFEITASA